VRFTDRYPIVVTDKKTESRDFFVSRFGFEIGFDSTWFCWLSAPDGSASIAFMTPDHPSAPPGPEVFSGLGLCFELQVESAAAALSDLRGRGFEPDYPLTEEPFGQIRFGLRAPCGLWIDVVEQSEPDADYWARYAI